MPKSYKIAMFLEDSRHYGQELKRGIARYSRTYGPWSFYREDQFYANRRKKGDLAFLKRWGVDGIITRDFKGAVALLEVGVPVVSVRNLGFLEDTVQITADNEAIGKMAFEHFSAKGFKEFAYCGFSNMPWSTQRQQSFTEAVQLSGADINSFKSRSSSRMLNREDEYNKIAKWLKFLPKPIGIFGCNDDRAYDIIEACKIAELEVPYEVAALGVDNDPQVCDFTNPPLSSILLGIEKAGYESADTLHKLIEGQKVDTDQVIVAPISVVLRQSTDIMACDDKMIAAALQFIRENSHELIQPIDVARKVDSSRRNLDEKFCKILGHTVFSEIRRVRSEAISRMLIETDLTISEIAIKLGYNDSDHIARVFRKAKKITPINFRNTYRHSIDRIHT